MKVVKNGYSSRATPRTGYHDSELVLEFDHTEDQPVREGAQKALVAYLQPNNMWCNVIESTKQRLVISYGYDSGD